MAETRQLPSWLRVILNLCGPVGLGVTLLGWVRPSWGIVMMVVGAIYVVWEVAPWTTTQRRRRPLVSLFVFVLVGAAVGASAWWAWGLAAPVPSIVVDTPPLAWSDPLPINYGTALSVEQLNAKSPVPGAVVYIPDIGAVLPVGRHPLTVSFVPLDTKSYASISKTVHLIVNPLVATPVPAPPIKPLVTGAAPTPPKQVPPPAAIRIASEKPLASADPENPCGLEITVVSDKEISPVALTIKFSGEVGRLYATQPLGMIQEQQGGIVAGKPDTILLEWRSPAFTPQSPLTVTVYSKVCIKTDKIESIPFTFPYPAGYLK
jgi:hypothetical protein